MFYHARELKYVACDKVGPPPIETLDSGFAITYEWLGQYCGYWPQVWLSRSHSEITGFRMPGKRNRAPDTVLFGFDYIKGFGVDYDIWCSLLTPLANAKSLAEANDAVRREIEDMAADPEPADAAISKTWRQCRDIDIVLQRHLFVERDQVVVPSLNLKAAKHIICRTEKQRKARRKMGFIEDRIEIRNLNTWSW